MCGVRRIFSRSLQAFAEDKHKDAFMIAEPQWSDQGVAEAKRLFFTLKMQAANTRSSTRARIRKRVRLLSAGGFNRGTLTNVKGN